MTKSIFCHLALAFIVTSATCAAQAEKISLPGSPLILSDQSLAGRVYLPDFSYAGYGFGEEVIPGPRGKVIDVTEYGAIANDGIDDSKAIQKALKVARTTDGPVTVKFPDGRFILSEVLSIDRSDIVIQGAGRGKSGTTLYFPRPLLMVGDDGRLDELREYLLRYNKRQREPDRNLDLYFSEYSWSGGFLWVGVDGARPSPYLEERDIKEEDILKQTLSLATRGRRGDFDIELENAGHLKAGERIELLWYNRQGEHGALIEQIYGETSQYPDISVGSHHWTFENRALVRQRTRVLEVTATGIRIADPLLHDISEALPADIARWNPLERVGFEDLRLEFPDALNFGHHMEQGYNGIYFSGAADSWARNLTIVNADSGIISEDSANLTYQNIRTEGERIAHYAVHMGNVHNVLAENIEVHNPVRHSLTFNTKATKSVYKGSVVYRSAVLDQHAGANHQNLFDDTLLYIDAVKDDDGTASYPVFNGSGAGYWQPGHGRFNTTWNLQVIVESGADAGQPVRLEGLAEGPDARIIGINGNRTFELDYRPPPYVSNLNQPLSIPSLYDYQLRKRLAE